MSSDVVVHPSHRMVPSMDVGSIVECDFCGGKNKNVLEAPCSSSASKDYSDIAPKQKPTVGGVFGQFFVTPDAMEPGYKDRTKRLEDLVRKAIDAYNALTPEEREAHDKAQRESWVRGMLWGDEGTRVGILRKVPDGDIQVEMSYNKLKMAVLDYLVEWDAPIRDNALLVTLRRRLKDLVGYNG